MRLPVLIASALVIISLSWRYINSTKTLSDYLNENTKSILSWSFILVLLSVLSVTQLSTIADMFAYIIILIIILNDGYDIARSI